MFINVYCCKGGLFDEDITIRFINCVIIDLPVLAIMELVI